MITIALIAGLVGVAAVLGMAGLLAFAVIRPDARHVWRSAATVGLAGLLVAMVALIYVFAQVGPCTNPFTC